MLFAELLELPMVGVTLDGQTVLALVAACATSHAVFVGTSLSGASGGIPLEMCVTYY